MKILLINNYPMDHAWELWKKKEYPAHHLWGATHLHKYGIDIDILPHEKYLFLKKISSKIKILGDLDQQLRILLMKDLNDYDMVYSACDLNTSLLAFLRFIGIFKKPIIAIMHRPFKSNFLTKLWFNGFIKNHDHFLCLSSTIRDNLNTFFKVPETKLSLITWGIDLSFYQVSGELKYQDNLIEKDETGFVVSAGKTYRDYNTIIKAFQKINYNLKIYGAENLAYGIPDIPSNVIISNKYLSFEQLIKEYEKAYAIAIPLDISRNSAQTVTQIGSTSLLEAMAMGKAVVMTRNRQIDIDIQKEGIGIFVEPEDVEGWKQAISYLLEHPQETKEMGKRARSLCESTYSYDFFVSNLASILKLVLENQTLNAKIKE